MKIKFTLVVVASWLLSSSVFAGIQDIHKEKLPDSPIIQNAYDFVASVEPLVRGWVQEWKYEEPKDRIVESFEAMLKDLRELADKEENRRNAELQLFIGLSAHYANNVDVKGSFDIALSSFQSAAKLLPNDYRPLWLIGEHLCQTVKPAEGMSDLLRVEETYPLKDLPEDFWADYLFCSHLTLMPEHGFRALHRASESGHLREELRKYYQGLIDTHLKPTESNQDYSFKELWVTKTGKTPEFSNASVGLSFTVNGNWRLQFGDLKHGNSTTSIELPEIAGLRKPMVPVVTIVTKLARPEESFEDFKKSILMDFKSTPFSVEFCDRMHCEAYDVLAPFYPDEGGARLLIILMERPEPEFPGLIFEYPHDLPSGKGSSGAKYYRAEAQYTRLKDKIRYAIVLESCVSIYPEAKKYFDSFLKKLVIE
jgi:hypothetical protein